MTRIRGSVTAAGLAAGMTPHTPLQRPDGCARAAEAPWGAPRRPRATVTAVRADQGGNARSLSVASGGRRRGRWASHARAHSTATTVRQVTNSHSNGVSTTQ